MWHFRSSDFLVGIALPVNYFRGRGSGRAEVADVCEDVHTAYPRGPRRRGYPASDWLTGYPREGA